MALDGFLFFATLLLPMLESGTVAESDNSTELGQIPLAFYMMGFLAVFGALVLFQWLGKMSRAMVSMILGKLRDPKPQGQSLHIEIKVLREERDSLLKRIALLEAKVPPKSALVPNEIWVAQSGASSVFHTDCFHLRSENARFHKLHLCKDCSAKRR